MIEAVAVGRGGDLGTVPDGEGCFLIISRDENAAAVLALRPRAAGVGNDPDMALNGKGCRFRVVWSGGGIGVNAVALSRAGGSGGE